MTAIRFGRVTTVTSIASTVGLFGLFYCGSTLGLRTETADTVLYLFAAVAVGAAFASWGTAVLHVRRGLRGGRDGFKRWSAIVILGAFVGAWAYWWFGAKPITPGK
jgi:hypothetical protein